jgi:hypothetical protein
MGMEQGLSTMVPFGERAQAIASYTRAFFRSVDSGEFSLMVENARSSGQLWLVERLYSGKVIESVVRTILGRVDRGHFVGDQLNDYVQDATVVLMQVAGQQKLDLTKSAGEIASYICLWIEQRVKRMARKDQRWRFSFLEVADDIEGPAGNAAVEEKRFNDWDPGLAGAYCPRGPSMEGKADAGPWRTTAGTEERSCATPSGARRSELSVLSIFGSSRSEKM